MGLGIGISVYFALPVEPPFWVGTLALAIFAVLGWLGRGLLARGTPGRGGPALVILALALGSLALGFAAAQWRTAGVAAPGLDHRVGPTRVEGRVVLADLRGDGLRVTLDRPDVARLDLPLTPHRLRLNLRGEQPDIRPGDWIRLRAVLTPPPAPSAPGAFDFQRQAFFQGVGAVGFALGRATVTARASEDGLEGLWLGLSRLRQAIAERVMAALPEPTGAVAAALMTGHRGAIPEAVMDNLRDAGLAHLLAISGLHIGLVAGILFVAVRALLALVPRVALRWPIKKWAAVAALLGACGYALLSGATVPTQRAFLMIGLVLLAVVLDRRGLSMRSVAWAAVFILLLHPESLLGASFQLSFAAVTALIATYEALGRVERHLGWLGRRGGGGGWLRRPLSYLAGVGVTTMVAGFATGPFALYHFNRVAVFGLAANLAAVPLTALWIMPWAVLAFLLMPLGLEGLALAPMAWGIDGVLAVAAGVAAWPGAVTLLPAMPVWGLGAIALGGLWLCLWRRPWRWAGASAVALGLASTALVIPPDVLIDEDGRLLAVTDPQGVMTVSSRATARFDREVWLRRAGQEAEPAVWPRWGGGAQGRLSCDPLGCLFRQDGLTVALARRPDALAEDCLNADVVVSPDFVHGACPSARRVIDKADLAREGTHALWLSDGRLRVDTVDRRRGDRPWVIRPAWARKRDKGL
ncbi:MAG: ComEC/Rec2 family competence protein [Rhodobacterales bacterium]|nr:ComEC/Rec2 family competence protein [Rhodobacterales bacterium]